MIRLVGLSLLSLVALVVCGYACVRALLSWRSERNRQGVMRDAQREADLREQAGRREARERAKDAIEDAAYRDEPTTATWTNSAPLSPIEWDAFVSTARPDRSHPLGWTVVALPGGVLCAVRSHDHPLAAVVDRWDSARCAWLRLTPDDPHRTQAAAAFLS